MVGTGKVRGQYCLVDEELGETEYRAAMITISWNCQGVGSTFHALKELKKKYDLDFIFLMETKNKSSKLEKMRKKLDFDKGSYAEPEGLSG